ncbi:MULTISPECIES: ParB N-terminal domain-containing protein [Nostocales]|uniref:ParB/RepB/Spo0J family partition protein n=2 Tax=Nostocales TaxID=1161 RepID=A0ABW8X017_9CYAN
MSPKQTSQRSAATTRKPRNVARKNAPQKKEEGSLDLAATLSKPLDKKEDDTQERAASLSPALDKKQDSSLAAAKMVPLNKIVMASSQPRRYFDPQGMRALFESVKRDGILMPLLVRPVGNKYELVAGERRYRAAKDVGLTEVPATIRKMSESQAVQYALVENLHS